MARPPRSQPHTVRRPLLPSAHPSSQPTRCCLVLWPPLRARAALPPLTTYAPAPRAGTPLRAVHCHPLASLPLSPPPLAALRRVWRREDDRRRGDELRKLWLAAADLARGQVEPYCARGRGRNRPRARAPSGRLRTCGVPGASGSARPPFETVSSCVTVPSVVAAGLRTPVN